VDLGIAGIRAQPVNRPRFNLARRKDEVHGDSHLGQAGMPKRTGEVASACFRIRDVGKTKAPARAYLRALFFDDQEVRQGGQLL
jgi:hypothetical protein